MDNATPTTEADRPPLSRRDFLGKVGLGAAAAATNVIVTPKVAAALGTSTGARRQTVAVFGGGVAGLTAAHELIERGFDVTVYERRAWGGKVRSTEVSGSASGGRRPLPSELGFQAEFGAFQNLPDTMRRIPFGSNPNGVFDNLEQLPQVLFAREGKSNLLLPVGSKAGQATTPQQILDLIVAVLVEMQLPPAAATHFANRMAVFMSSCDARRVGQWERTSWTDFIGADSYGEDYRKFPGRFPEFIQGVKAEEASAKYPALVFESFVIYPLLGRGTTGPVVSTLNLPSNEAWINPWVAALQQLGARLQLQHELIGFNVRDGRIASADLLTPFGRAKVVADWFVCALPVERARRLWNRAILAVDPTLARMNNLPIADANGVMFYLREPARIVDGILGCTDSPWALSLIPQAPVWSGDFARIYGDGQAHDRLSTIIATWDRPGVLYGKAAHDCTPNEFALDAWEQIKRHVNKAGRAPVLTDDMLLSWNLDPTITFRDGHLRGEDPLVLPTVATEQYRPDVRTGVFNLMLCGDYLSGAWEVANLEAANHTGRRAANAILERSGSREAQATVPGPYRPPEWEPSKRIDDERYKLGQPNLFDTPLATSQVPAPLRLIPG